MKELTHKEVCARGGKATAKKLGKKGLKEKMKKMTEASLRARGVVDKSTC